MSRTFLASSALMFALTACSETDAKQKPVLEPSSEKAELLGRGEAIVENLCATCHAIDKEGSSPHPDAVPLRQLSWKYPVDDLEQPFLQGIIVGHPDMPEWQFTPQDVDALLAYIKSIQEPRAI